MHNDEKSPVLLEAVLTREEENILKARLFTLLTKQVWLKTQGDHSSLREEDAAELLDSLLFTLRYHLYRQGLPQRTLLTADLQDMLRQGQDALQSCVEETRNLYQKALESVETFSSRSLTDTLQGIGQFFGQYDFRLYAHHMPASIDYQLCLPVGAQLRGVLYIRVYLQRLLMENRLVTCFAPERVSQLLLRSSPDYRDLLVNLFEPVAANAVGLALLDADIASLRITHGDAGQIHTQLAALPPAYAKRRLTEAARAVCCILAIDDADFCGYLTGAAEALYPRLVLSEKSACGVFYSC